MIKLRILCVCVALMITATIAVEDKIPDSNVAEDTIAPPDESANYESPYAAPGMFYFAEHFDDLDKFSTRWVKSETKKDDISEEISKYDGVWAVESPHKTVLNNDFGLVLKSKAKHAAIASRLIKPFVFTDKPFVLQYEVQLQDGQECGGSYIKLLSSGKETTDLKQFNDKTPYTIMFGPDKCGNDIKLHFIFRHVNPLNGTISEKHCRKPKERIEEPFKDKQPHLYTLILRPDNTYTIKVDHRIVNEGSLLTDFSPAVNPPIEINDPKDIKPSNWDEREKIADPEAVKPADWDEDAPPQIPDASTSKPENWLDDEEVMIPDPTAIKPADWENDIDGEWEAPLVENPICEKAVGCGLWMAPLITNPNYKGKWRAPLIDNPNYQGKWAPKRIPNPEYFEDKEPFKMTTIAAIGLELWSMSSDILFDNIIITENEDYANEWAAQTYDLKRKQIDKEAETFVNRIVNYTNENPVLWAVYLIAGGLPLAFLIYYCCSSSTQERPIDLSAKKTDEQLADDDEQFVQEQKAKLAAGDDKPKRRTSPRNKKSDLDEPTESADQDDEEDEDTKEEDQSDEPEQEPRASTEPASETTRKRKPRKE